MIHAFTALGAIVGLYAINAIYHQEYVLAFLLMGVAIFIDAIDGTFARRAHVKTYLPDFDGALLDNVIDYLNYAFVPAFFILLGPLVEPEWRPFAASFVLLTSAYQFCQTDAKTKDHFFKGFPSYWNIAVFYFFFWQTVPITNLLMIITLGILVFVPIKYVYPSRLEYLTDNLWLRKAMMFATIIWGATTFGLIWIHPTESRLLSHLSQGYVLLYILVSLYRTFVPLEKRLAT